MKQGDEIFTLMATQFNVTEGLKITADGREPVEVDLPSVMRLAKLVHLNEEHVANVCTDKPGLIASLGGDLLLIDGYHRGAKLSREGRDTITCLLLTEDETKQIIVSTKPQFSVPLPPAMNDLPRDHRGYPVPFTTLIQPDGKVDFRVTNERNRQLAIKNRWCAICGKPLDYWIAFIGGPKSGG